MRLDFRFLASRKLWDNKYHLLFEVQFGELWYSSPKNWRNEYVYPPPPQCWRGAFFFPYENTQGTSFVGFYHVSPWELSCLLSLGLQQWHGGRHHLFFPQQPYFPIFAKRPLFCLGVNRTSFMEPFSSLTTWTLCTWKNALNGSIKLD